jgi:hypothetical protein
MAPGTGQPDIPGQLVVQMDDVTATENGGLRPSTIINQPNTFTLSTTFTIQDTFAGLLDGDKFDVQHYFTRIEDNKVVKRVGGTVTAALVAGKIVMPYTSTPFTTGNDGDGKDLEVPPGETEGNFRVLTQLVAQDPGVRAIVAAFQDGLLLEVLQ